MKIADLHKLIITLPWHPIYSICQGIILGITFHTSYSKSFAFALVCSCIHLLFSHINYQKALFFLVLGLFLGSYQAYQVEHNFFVAALAVNKNKISLVATITDLEQIDENHTQYDLKIREAEDKKHALTSLYRWNIRIIGPKNTSFLVGDHILITNLYINLWISNKDYRTYLINNSLLGTIRTKEKPTLIKRPDFSLTRRLKQWRKNVITKIRCYVLPETAELIETIFLGKKERSQKSILKKYRKHFQRWGISHYLARSGLHLSLVALIISLVGLCVIPWFWLRIWLVILTCLLYATMSWSSISFNRALSLLLLLSIGSLRKRPPHPLTLFCWVVTATLLLSPYQLFALDFQLSFLLSGILIWNNQIKFMQSLA